MSLHYEINTWKAATSVAAYAAAIASANMLTAHFGLVPVGFGLMVTAGTYAAGFALLARDFVQRYAGIWWALVGVLVGIVLSWVLATPGARELIVRRLSQQAFDFTALEDGVA